MRVLITLLTAGAALLSAPVYAQEIDWQRVDATWFPAMFIVTDFHGPIFR